MYLPKQKVNEVLFSKIRNGNKLLLITKKVKTI